MSLNSTESGINSTIQVIINFFQAEISLIWIVFGTIGNLISIVILSMPKMRKHSTFTYLTVLALCDTLVLYFGLLRDYLVSKYKFDINGDYFCKFHVFSFYFVLHMASWLLVAVNIDRLIAVSFLSLSKKWCTPQVAMLVSLFLAISLALINSHLIFFIDSDEDLFIVNSNNYLNNNNSGSSSSTSSGIKSTNSTNRNYSTDSDYTIISTKLAFYDEMSKSSNGVPVNPYVYQKCLIKTNYPTYNYFFKYIFTWIDASLQVIFPFIIMLLCNMNIIHQVLFARRSSKGKNMKRLKKIKGMCYMILSLSILFFILEAPVLIFISLMQDHWMEDQSLQLIWTIINLMMYTNHVINFISYCMTGTKFRRELLRLLLVKTTISAAFSNFKFSSLYSTRNKSNNIRADNPNGTLRKSNNMKSMEKNNSLENKKSKKKNLHVNFDTQKKSENHHVANTNNSSIQNSNNARIEVLKDAELEFILSKIKSIESEMSTESSPSISKLPVKSKFISLKLKTFSKRKVISNEKPSNNIKNSLRDYDDIDIEMDDDDDIA